MPYIFNPFTGTLDYYASASGGGMSIGGAVTSGTAGSVLFVDASGNLGQNNSKFFWDNTNHSLNIGNGFISISNSTSRAGSFTYPTSPLSVYGNHSYSDGSGTFSIHDQSNPSLVLYMGYDSVAGFAYIQSIIQQNAFSSLVLNPNGGSVSIGGSDIPDANTLQVDNAAAASSVYGTGVTEWVGSQASTVGNLFQLGFGYHQHGSVSVPSNIFGIALSTPDGGGSNLSGDFVWASITGIMGYNSTPIERMRLKNTGNLLLGTATVGGSLLRMVGLPTSAAGLSSGDVWNNSGVLTII